MLFLVFLNRLVCDARAVQGPRNTGVNPGLMEVGQQHPLQKVKPEETT